MLQQETRGMNVPGWPIDVHSRCLSLTGKCSKETSVLDTTTDSLLIDGVWWLLMPENSTYRTRSQSHVFLASTISCNKSG